MKDLYEDDYGCVRPGFTHVADNLPEVMQYIDLVNDANFAFGLPDLPPMMIESRNALTGELYAAADAKNQMKAKISNRYEIKKIILKVTKFLSNPQEGLHQQTNTGTPETQIRESSNKGNGKSSNSQETSDRMTEDDFKDMLE